MKLIELEAKINQLIEDGYGYCDVLVDGILNDCHDITVDEDGDVVIQ